MDSDARGWVSRAVAGERRALGRVCRLLEEGLPDVREALYSCAVPSGWVIGITGSPGAGKSTLTSALVAQLREQYARVGVVAVDPSSPVSGGALLGDRIRMQRHTEDSGVFIRSAATRGVLGGLSRVSSDLVRALRVWGAGCVVVETVGVGQDEFDISALADTTCVVFSPGQGDDVQANKAGLIELADVLVVNKSDLPGASQTVSDLQGMLSLAAPAGDARRLAHSWGHTQGGHTFLASLEAVAPSLPEERCAEEHWEPRVVSTCARDSAGVTELVQTLHLHRDWLSGSLGQRERARRSERAAVRRVELAVLDRVRERGGAQLELLATAVARDECTPDRAADELLLGLLDDGE